MTIELIHTIDPMDGKVVAMVHHKDCVIVTTEYKIFRITNDSFDELVLHETDSTGRDKSPAISKHHLDRERQLENRFKDKHIIMDEYEVKGNGELIHISRKSTPLKDKS